MRRRLFVQIWIALVALIIVLVSGSVFVVHHVLDPSEHLDGPPSFTRFLTHLGLMALAMGIGAWPLARSITGRLERLQRGVERWGNGDLGARVDVEGSDEVAELARGFNAAAHRVEGLVEGQRRMLSSASHELRSPLARVRMAIEMVDDPRPDRRALIEAAKGDIAELDELIDDLLLSSRLEARPLARETVDLGALAVEEASKVGATAAGAGVVQGDARALRRLVRNLAENAVRHGGAAVHVAVEGTRLVVEDRGPGIPESERERIFEPFYRPASHSEGTDGGVGLGLALVRQIAEKHGGRAWVDSRDGGGARFVVELA
jgi:signal transduction histidine kinase